MFNLKGLKIVPKFLSNQKQNAKSKQKRPNKSQRQISWL